MTDEDDTTRRVEERIDAASDVYERQGKIVRAVWIAVAILLVLAGLVMIVFPGPAAIVIPLGLSMLAAVFGGARRLLVRSIRTGVKAKKVLENADTQIRLLGVAALTSLVAAVIALFAL
ncbi:MAG: PGPGW domain-containing protein [Nitriliruptorales bacterium]